MSSSLAVVIQALLAACPDDLDKDTNFSNPPFYTRLNQS
jgi:hypothetical protein